MRTESTHRAGEGSDETHVETTGNFCDPTVVADYRGLVTAAFAEAGDDFTLIEPALAAHFSEHGSYPEALAELDVATDVVTPTDGRAVYSYRPVRPFDQPADSGLCEYFLSVRWDALLDDAPPAPPEIHHDDC